MTADLGELERLARAAAAGTWSKSRGLRGGYSIDADEREVVASDEFGRFGAIEVEEDASFIAAANPATILALISRVRAAEGALRPFAAWAGGFDGDAVEYPAPDDASLQIVSAYCQTPLKVSHLRAARDAVKATPASSVGMSEANETKPLSLTNGGGGSLPPASPSSVPTEPVST